jgi:hypothetical protein
MLPAVAFRGVNPVIDDVKIELVVIPSDEIVFTLTVLKLPVAEEIVFVLNDASIPEFPTNINDDRLSTFC